MLSDRDIVESMLMATGGKTVTVGGEETVGHYEIADGIELGELVLVGQPMLVVPSSVPGFVDGAEIEIEDEGSFIVRVSERERDGALRRVALRDA